MGIFIILLGLTFWGAKAWGEVKGEADGWFKGYEQGRKDAREQFEKLHLK